MKTIFNYKSDFFFPKVAVFLGYLIAVVGVYLTVKSNIYNLIIILIGLAISTTYHGVLIDVTNNKIKEYVSLFSFKVGNWKENQYKYISVLEVLEKNRMFSSSANIEFSDKEKVFKIVLLNYNHYQRLMIKKLNNKEQAHQEALKIAEQLNFEKVIFSPNAEL